MKFYELLTLSLLTMGAVWSLYYWVDRWRGQNKGLVEKFEGAPTITEADLARLATTNAKPPTDKDAEEAYRTLLKYIQADFSKGVKFVYAFGETFFPPNLPLKNGLNVNALLDNYMSPLNRV
jgi:hypothetical protein